MACIFTCTFSLKSTQNLLLLLLLIVFVNELDVRRKYYFIKYVANTKF